VPSAPAVAARETIAKIARSHLTPHELLAEVAVQIQNVIRFEHGGGLLLDHATLLPTGRACPYPHPALANSLLRNEVLTPDVHKFAELARQPVPVATRAQLAPEAEARSVRMGSILTSAGLGDEIRVVFRAGETVWGAGSFTRGADTPPYDEEQIRFVADIAEDVGRGLRASLARRANAAPRDRAPGVLLVDEHLEIVSETPAARSWRAGMEPRSLMAIHAIALSSMHDPENERTRRTRVRLMTGEWLVLTAAPMATRPGDPQLTIVTLDRLPQSERVRLLLRLHGLSAREREVTQLLLQGFTTDAIAARLLISRNTLRSHVKSTFAKVGVTSRPELMAVLAGDAPRGR